MALLHILKYYFIREIKKYICIQNFYKNIFHPNITWQCHFILIAIVFFNTFKAHEYAFSPTLMDFGSSSSKSSQILTSPSLPQVTIQL